MHEIDFPHLAFNFLFTKKELRARWGIPSQVITLQANIIMRTSKILGSVVALSLFATALASAATLNLPTMSCSYSFNTSMGIGARGETVRDLQKVLNMYPQTQVSLSGAGSPGYETTTFGPATKAAVVKFQKLHPADTLATGYVGPLTRALLNMVCNGSNGGSNGSGTGTGTGTGVSVSSTANNGGVIVAGAAQVPVLNFRVTNNTSSAVTVNALRFTKTGILSDSNISNAYLSIGNNIIAQYTGLSQGVITFSGVGAVVGAGSSADMTLRVDVSSNAANSNLVAFQLGSASDVTLSAGSVGGSFPINGGNYYVSTVSNPSLAAVTLAYQTVSTTVDAGTTGFRSGSVSMNVTNNPVKLQSVRFTVSGSINIASDLANLKLRVDGSEVASAASVMSDGKVVFDLMSMPKTLSTGSHQLEVYTDVLGTANRTYKFEILRPYDMLVMDTQYNTNISVGTPSGSSTTITVRPGTATMTLASDTPTGNIALGGSNVTLAKFSMRAAGEGLRIKFLPFTITNTGDATWGTVANVDSDIRNIGLFADDGTQVGSTINTPSTCSYGITSGANSYACSFGSSSSNINYLVPANTTRVFSIKADIQNTASVTSLQAALTAPGSNNVEGQISFQTSTVPSGTISGSTLTISASPFQGSLNSAVGTQTYVGGAHAVRIGSFTLSASSAEGINVTNLTIKTGATVNASTTAFNIQNLALKVDGVTWSNTFGTVAAATSYNYSAPSGTYLVPAGQSKVVDVYADLNTNSTTTTITYASPVSLVDAQGTGVSTNTNQVLRNSAGTAITSSNVAGQNVTVAGAGSLTVSADTSNPSAKQLVLGSTAVTLGQFRFKADNNEDIRLDQITLTATSSASNGPATFNNLTLWDGSTQIASGNTLTASSTNTYNFTSLFNVTGGYVVPKNTTKILTLKGDVADYSSSPTSVSKTYAFGLAGAVDVRAFGAASTVQSTVTGSTAFPLNSSTQTAVRTKVTATLAPSGSVQNRTRTATDDIALLSLTADQAYSAEFRTVTFTISGAAASSTTFQLIDKNGAVVPGASASVVGAATTVTLAPTNPELISQGDTKVYRVRVSSSNFNNTANTSDSYSIQIANTSDFGWREDGGSTNIGLEATAVPLTSTVSYE